MADYPQDKVRVAQEIADRNLVDQLQPEQRQRFDAMVAAGVVEYGKPQQEAPAQGNGPMPYSEVIPQAIKNTPRSALNYANTVGQAFLHPIETANAVGNVALGTVEKLVPGEQDAEKYADAVGAAFKHRFLTEQGFRETLAKDPVSLLGDASSIFLTGGALLRGAGTAASSAPVAKAGETLSKIGRVSDPVNMAQQGAASAYTKMSNAFPKTSPEGLVMSALKKSPLSSSLTPAEQLQNAQTVLREKTPVSRSGLEKLTERMSFYDSEIDRLVTEAANTGDTIPKTRLAQALEDMKDPSGKWALSDKPDAYFKLIDNQIKRINALPDNVPVAYVQRLKTNLQGIAKYDAKSNKSIQQDIVKTYASAARQALADKYPALAEVNATDAAAHRLKKALDGAVTRIDSWQLFNGLNGLKVAAPAYVGNLLLGDMGAGAGAAAGVIASIIDDPRVKSQVAFALDEARKRKLTAQGGKVTEARRAAYASGRANEETQGVRVPLRQE